MLHFVSAFCPAHIKPQHLSTPLFTRLSRLSGFILSLLHFVLPPLCLWASHHCMTEQNRDSFLFPIWGSIKRRHPYCRSAANPEYKSSVGRGYSFRCPRCTTLFPLYKSRCIVRKKSRKPMGVICNFVIASIVE